MSCCEDQHPDRCGMRVLSAGCDGLRLRVLVLSFCGLSWCFGLLIHFIISPKPLTLELSGCRIGLARLAKCLWLDDPPTLEALIIRIGFWGPLYYNLNKEPPTIV